VNLGFDDASPAILTGRSRPMPVEMNQVMRPSLRLRADVPDPETTLITLLVRPAILVLAVLFVAVGGSSLELGPTESRLALAATDPIGPYGRVFGYWDPSTWPGAVALGRIWGYFEEVGPTMGAVRWPSAIAAALIGILIARRARLVIGPRAGLLVAIGWFGSVAAIDRSGGAGLDMITGLGMVAALDRLLARGSGWSVGFWASFAFLAGGWPPLAVLGLSTVVLGRSGTTWKWSMTLPVASTVALGVVQGPGRGLGLGAGPADHATLGLDSADLGDRPGPTLGPVRAPGPVSRPSRGMG
jgi:hypothetical protein